MHHQSLRNRLQHLTFLNEFHHQTYRKAIKHLSAAMARMVNDRESLGYNWQGNFEKSLDRHLHNYRALERRQLQLAQRYAQQFNFVAFEDGTASFARAVKALESNQRFV